MNKTLLKTTNNKNYNKNYNFKKDLSLHLKSSREPASTTLLGKLFLWTHAIADSQINLFSITFHCPNSCYSVT